MKRTRMINQRGRKGKEEEGVKSARDIQKGRGQEMRRNMEIGPDKQTANSSEMM